MGVNRTGHEAARKALNAFLRDIYYEQADCERRHYSTAMVVRNKYFRPEMAGLHVPQNIYITASGIDLIRDEKGRYYVLEDNLRTPSGFSYLYKGRSLMTELFSDLYLVKQRSGYRTQLECFPRLAAQLAPSGKAIRLSYSSRRERTIPLILSMHFCPANGYPSCRRP